MTAVMVCTLVVALADLGVFSGFDAAIGAFALALFFPDLSPVLLLSISSIQDAPGLAGIAWYLGVVMVGVVAVCYGTINHVRAGYSWLSVNRWGMAATFVVLFALQISVAQDFFGGLAQAPERSPFAVGGLMIFMTWIGIHAAFLLRRQPQGIEVVTAVVLMLLLHGLSIALAQVFIDSTFMASSQGLAEIEDSSQLSIETAVGIPRIHGTYLTPNAFALCMILLVLVVRAVRKDERFGFTFAFFWFGLGMVLSALSLSKAIGIFFLLTTFFMFVQLAGWKAVLGVFLLGLAVLGWLLSSGLTEELLSAFRITSELGGDSYRAQAWHLVVSKFNWYDWITGAGLSHWPVLFDTYMGVRLSDPHTWLLSVPGTFGLIGTLFFLAIIYSLIRIVFKSTGNAKMVAISLLTLFLVKDMFSIPYLLGNTPLSFLIWLILALTLTSKSQMRKALP